MKTSTKLLCLMAIVAVMATACKDDDKDDTTTPGQNGVEIEDGKIAPASLTNDEQHLLDQQQAILNILSNLTDFDLSNINGNPLDKSYQPTYGEVRDEAKPLVRSVKCETADDAQKMFLSIVNTDTLVTATSDGMEITLKDMPLLANGDKVSFGALSFHKGDGAQSVGYIDVDVKCIPTLERIDFVPESAWGDNASTSGTPYRVGDLVLYDPPSPKYCTGYYLCVSQSTNGTKNGLLVHLCEGDKGGDETINLDGDKQGCWKPYNNDHGFVASVLDCSIYIGFLATKKALVKKIKQYLNGEMTKKPTKSGKLWHVMPGGFNNNSNVVYTGSTGARIIYNAWFGSYAWIPAYDYRHCAYYFVPNGCTSDGQCCSGEQKYVKDSDWNSTNFYAINVIRFADQEISGTTIEYSPLTDAEN